MPLLPLEKDLLLLLLERIDTALGVAAVDGAACCLAAPEGLVAQRDSAAAWREVRLPPMDTATAAFMLRSEASLFVDIATPLVDMLVVQTNGSPLAVWLADLLPLVPAHYTKLAMLPLLGDGRWPIARRRQLSRNSGVQCCTAVLRGRGKGIIQYKVR